jgi:hypothetical protein
MVAGGLAIGVPFLVFFGWLSDRIGRKPIIMTGCALAALTYFPLFHALTNAANPDLAAASASAPITVVADPADCTFQFDPVGKAAFNSSCDIAKTYLAKAGLPYANEAAPPGAIAQIRVGSTSVASFDGRGMAKADLTAKKTAWETEIGAATAAAAYPKAADSAKVNVAMVVGLLAVLMIYVAMVYGPIAAMLVEMFPANIRYTSMSLPYHLGNGWFGGFLPTTAFAMVAASGDIYFGLWYPVTIAAITFVIGVLFVHDRRGARIDV